MACEVWGRETCAPCTALAEAYTTTGCACGNYKLSEIGALHSSVPASTPQRKSTCKNTSSSARKKRATSYASAQPMITMVLWEHLICCW